MDLTVFLSILALGVAVLHVTTTDIFFSFQFIHLDYALSLNILFLVPYDDAELVVLLQSLVLACQGGDTQALSTLSQHLTPLLGPEHLHLLHILVTEMNRS